MRKMKWSILSGDVNWETYGGKLVSPPQNNGEFDYWLVLEVIEWEEAVGEHEAAEIDGSHNVCLSVVAPSECPEADLQSAFESCGWGEGANCEIEWDNPLMLVELLHSYGIAAHVWSADGNLRDLLREGKKQAVQAEFLFGFAMDRPQNALGATGWDWLRGNLCPSLQE